MLYQNGLTHLIDDPDFQKIFATALFDHHTYPMTRMFGLERCYQIDWVPLDNELADGDTMTNSLLNFFGIDSVVVPKINQTTDARKKTIARLRELSTQLNFQNSLIHIYDDDLILYDTVNETLRFHEVKNMDWQQCSWLTNFKTN